MSSPPYQKRKKLADQPNPHAYAKPNIKALKFLNYYFFLLMQKRHCFLNRSFSKQIILFVKNTFFRSLARKSDLLARKNMTTLANVTNKSGI